jgi:putative MATE family efflux protein
MTRIKARYAEVRDFLSEAWALGWPMMLVMFFQFSIGIADVYVAGYMGTDVLAAVGYVGQLYFTLIILANGISVGTVSMVSQAFGAKSTEGVGNVASHSLVLGVAISGLLTGLAQGYTQELVRLAGMPEGIQDIAAAFIRIFSLVLVPTYVMIISAGILRASGRIRMAMTNSAVAASLNVLGDLILGFGWGPIPALGFRGIAWSSALASTVGMTLNLLCVSYGPNAVSWVSIIRPRVPCLRNLIKIGVPTALQQTAWNAGTLVVYFLVGQLAHGQITALAAMTAGLRIEALIFLPIFAFNMACAVLTGNRLGSGDTAGARSGAKAAALLCLSIIIVPAFLIFVFAPSISALLASDPEVLAEMTRYLRINMLGMPFMAIGITFGGALQGAGDTLATMRIIFTGMWLIRIPLILAVMHVFHAGAVEIWWSMTFSIIIMCGLLVNRFRGNAWIAASFDRKTKTMLWEACLGSTMALSEESSLASKKYEHPQGLQSVPEKGSSTTCL